MTEFLTMDMRPVALVLGLMGFLLIETWRPARPWRQPRLRRLRFHGLLAVFNSAILRIVVVTPFLVWAQFVHDQQWGLLPQLHLPWIGEMTLAVMALDGLDYWWHRWNHGVKWLWRFHQVHHVDTHLDVTTSLRFHVLELFFSSFVEAAWILLLGPKVATYALFKMLITFSAQFHHSNVDLGDRWDRLLSFLIVTPRFHAHHHRVDFNQGSGANFSTIFSGWDRLFQSHQPTHELVHGALGLEKGRDQELSFKAAFLSRYF